MSPIDRARRRSGETTPLITIALDGGTSDLRGKPVISTPIVPACADHGEHCLAQSSRARISPRQPSAAWATASDSFHQSMPRWCLVQSAVRAQLDQPGRLKLSSVCRTAALSESSDSRETLAAQSRRAAGQLAPARQPIEAHPSLAARTPAHPGRGGCPINSPPVDQCPLSSARLSPRGGHRERSWFIQQGLQSRPQFAVSFPFGPPIAPVQLSMFLLHRGNSRDENLSAASGQSELSRTRSCGSTALDQAAVLSALATGHINRIETGVVPAHAGLAADQSAISAQRREQANCACVSPRGQALRSPPLATRRQSPDQEAGGRLR